MERETKKISVRIIQAIIILFSCITVFLLAYIIYNSFRTKGDFISNTFGAPTSLSLDNYKRVLVDGNFMRYFLNSIIVLGGSLLLSVFLSSTVAYGLGRYRFKGKNGLKIYFLIGLMFPVQLGIVPIFLMMKNLSLIDTHLSVILICGSGISMSVFLLTDFFAKLPQEMYEAAVIDGAGEFTTFYKIMFPLASPVVFSMSIVTAVQVWNQFFVPLIFMQSEANKTVPLFVVKYTKKLLNTVDFALASSVLAVIPILILFMIFSRKILEGVAEGGIKG